MSSVEVDQEITGTLDDMEMEHLVSLLQDDTVFHELNKLDLPLIESFNPDQKGLAHIDGRPLLDHSTGADCFDFQDALDFFSDGSTNAGNCLISGSQSNASCNSTSSDPSSSYVYLSTHSNVPSTQASNDVLSDLFCPDYNTSSALAIIDLPQPVGPLLTAETHDLTTRQATVQHDHTYATKDPVNSSSMLTALSSVNFCDRSNGKNSDTEEGSASDTGTIRLKHAFCSKVGVCFDCLCSRI